MRSWPSSCSNLDPSQHQPLSKLGRDLLGFILRYLWRPDRPRCRRPYRRCTSTSWDRRRSSGLRESATHFIFIIPSRRCGWISGFLRPSPASVAAAELACHGDVLSLVGTVDSAPDLIFIRYEACGADLRYVGRRGREAKPAASSSCSILVAAKATASPICSPARSPAGCRALDGRATQRDDGHPPSLRRVCRLPQLQCRRSATPLAAGGRTP